jgi:hypothetical protein
VVELEGGEAGALDQRGGVAAGLGGGGKDPGDRLGLETLGDLVSDRGDDASAFGGEVVAIPERSRARVRMAGTTPST